MSFTFLVAGEKTFSTILPLSFVVYTHNILFYSDNSLIRLDRLEYHIREEMNKTAPRTMVVLHPLKVLLYGANLFEKKVIKIICVIY